MACIINNIINNIPICILRDPGIRLKDMAKLCIGMETWGHYLKLEKREFRLNFFFFDWQLLISGMHWRHYCCFHTKNQLYHWIFINRIFVIPHHTSIKHWIFVNRIFVILKLELEVAAIQMNEDDSRRGKKQFCLFESPVVPKVKIEFLLEVVDSCTFQ